MTTAKIGYINLADDANLSASTQVLLAPITRLQDPHIGVKWQSLGGADWFVVDLGAMTSVDVCRVMGLTADTIRICYSTTDPTLGDVFDTGALAVNQAFLTHTDIRTVTCRYIRVDLTSGTVCEAGRVFVGTLESPRINFGWNWTRKWVDPSDRKKTEGGQTRINRRVKYRVFSVTFGFLSGAEASGFTDDIDRINGMTDDVLFIAKPDSTNLEQDSIWGLMTDLSPIAQQFIDIWSKPISIEQRL